MSATELALRSMLPFRLGGLVELAVLEPIDPASGVASLELRAANMFDEELARVTVPDSRRSFLEKILEGPNCIVVDLEIFPKLERSPAFVCGRPAGVVQPSAPT